MPNNFIINKLYENLYKKIELQLVMTGNYTKLLLVQKLTDRLE